MAMATAAAKAPDFAMTDKVAVPGRGRATTRSTPTRTTSRTSWTTSDLVRRASAALTSAPPIWRGRA